MDTLKMTRVLTADQLFTREQAERLAGTLAEAVEAQAASKADLSELSGKVGADLAGMAGRISVVDMKLNILLALTLVVLGKLFFKT